MDLGPAWLKRTFGVGAGTVPANDAIRSALTLPLVLGAAFMLTGQEATIYAGLGALLVVLGERGGTTGQRMFKAGAGLLTGTFAMAFGPLTSGTGLLPLLAVAGFALISGVLSSFGTALSFAGMQLLVQMSIAGGLSIPLSQGAKLEAYIAGGLAALAGVWIQSALEETERQYGERLATVLEALALWGRSVSANWVLSDAQPVRALRFAVDARLAEASDLILTARPLRKSRQSALAQLSALRDQISVQVTEAFTSSARPDKMVLAAIEENAAKLKSFRPDAPHSAEPLPAARPAIPIHWLIEQSLFARATWVFVLRLVICMVIAEIIRQVTPLGHAYWILLTVALVLKPDLASVFSRSLQRGFGTALGLLIGWIAMFLSPGLVILLVIAPLCAAIPYSVRRNYAWFSVIITPLVFILLDFGGPVGTDVLVQRLDHTATGCGIVLLFGYALWPATWRPSARPEIAEICDALAAFIDCKGATTVQRADARLAIARKIAALRSRAAQALSEPEPMRMRAQHWSDVTEALDDVLVKAVLHDPAANAETVEAPKQMLHVLASRLRERAAIRQSLPAPGHDALAKSVDALGHRIAELRLYGEAVQNPAHHAS